MCLVIYPSSTIYSSIIHLYTHQRLLGYLICARKYRKPGTCYIASQSCNRNKRKKERQKEAIVSNWKYLRCKVFKTFIKILFRHPLCVLKIRSYICSVIAWIVHLLPWLAISINQDITEHFQIKSCIFLNPKSSIQPFYLLNTTDFLELGGIHSCKNINFSKMKNNANMNK